MTIQYEYAQKRNNVVRISNVTERDRQDNFFCLGCGQQLIPVLGKQVESHFRHKTELTCSGETYLHNLAKNKFYEAYSKCLEQEKPFLIKVPMTSECNFYAQKIGSSCKETEIKEFDLTQHFSEKPLLESKHENFIPDILLKTRKGVPLFVEIKVSHSCSQDKIDSKYRIIEIEINSIKDINFNTGILTEAAKVQFINFSTTSLRTCDGQCPELIKIERIAQERKNVNEFYEEQEKRNARRLSLDVSPSKKKFKIDGRVVWAYNYYDALEELSYMPEIYPVDYLEDPELIDT